MLRIHAYDLDRLVSVASDVPAVAAAPVATDPSAPLQACPRFRTHHVNESSPKMGGCHVR